MRAVILGAGGLGSYLGAALSRAGRDVGLITRGAHAAAIRSMGLRVRVADDEFVVRPRCHQDASEVDEPGVVFVTVKAFALEGVGPAAVQLSERGGLIIPLLNGVDAAERLVAMGVAADRVVPGIAYLTAFRTAPGIVERRGGHQRIVVGRPTRANRSVLDALARLFDDSGVSFEIAEDIRVELWRKMAVVCALTALCGITRGPMGPVRAHPLGRSLQGRAVAEVMTVGRLRGVPLTDEDEQHVQATLDAFPNDFYPSPIHDLKSARPTEIDALCGTIAHLAAEHGDGARVHEAATLAVQLWERGNAVAFLG